MERDNPFSRDGELRRKADYIIQNSSFDKKNLKVVDPDLEHGDSGDASKLSGREAGDESFPVVMRKIEPERPVPAEEVSVKKRRNKLNCCTLQ